MTLESKTNEVDDQRNVTVPVEFTTEPGDEARFQAACQKLGIFSTEDKG